MPRNIHYKQNGMQHRVCVKYSDKVYNFMGIPSPFVALPL